MMMSLILRSAILLTLLLSLYGTSVGAGNFCSWYRKDLECQRDQFRCLNGKNCIDRDLYCNGEDDCDDNSDERYCRVNSCPEKFRGCSQYNYPTKCIPNEWYCDVYRDCEDGNDENNCRYTTVRSETRAVTPQNRTVVNKVLQWFNRQRKLSSSEKWGFNVDRFVLIHYLAGDYPQYSSLYKDEIMYELSIQLLSQLSRMKLEDIPSTELASYINAFLVTCINPRKFHGHDIIKELRNRADQENYTNPYVFLTLCNSGETITESDKNKLIGIFENKHRMFWTDVQAVVVLALACANKQPGNEVDPEILREMAQELKQQQFRNGTVFNLPTTALVMQALISINSESDPDNFDESKAFQELLRNQLPDGSFGDLMNTFLVTPVLTCKSLADINSTHCDYGTTDEKSALKNLSRRQGPKIRVQYSLWIGNDKDLERNLILRVPQNLTLYNIMEIAAEVDSRFKFEYLVKDRKPYISAISEMRDDPLTGKFWFLYFVQNGEASLLTKSPADIVPKDNDHYVMWYRRGTWVD